MEAITDDTDIEKLRIWYKQIYIRLELFVIFGCESYKEEALYLAEYIRNIRLREYFYTCI